MTSARADGRLPLTIVGGFLGAGKSTWLRHQLSAGAFADHAVVVNEAAETPIDNLLLARARRLETLAAGCACCEGRAALVALLRGLCDRAWKDGIAGVVLETSGLADPAGIAAAVAGDPVLARRIAIARVISLVDGLNGALQLAAESLARAQAEAADTLVLTKAGMAEQSALARLTATLRRLNPVAEVVATERGAPARLPDGAAAPYRLPELAAAAPIRPRRLRIGAEAGWAALSTWLSALLVARGDDVVRVKGVVATPAGRLLIQSVRQRVQPPEILPPDDAGVAGPPPEVGTLVLLGRGIDEDLLERSWRRFGG
ncbi:CobW family GTP-binding protein [Amaricoccus solimangrovi]|uniref:GTP-binding protein n=1 Tax=Amaricoccus solimangrovi TaxID=2589815 RepID=A0A501WHB2_9RHOB|nr:GTP-binding protein [Amaricoccus solimangrovi]TPE49283.1 GTP-binding protein [Amaricoccus solimangrovi]